MKDMNNTKSILIPENYFMLTSGKLYSGRTLEYTETNSYVPMSEGRSSIVRPAMFIHVTTGFGAAGFSGY
jgi:dCTP deaminase